MLIYFLAAFIVLFLFAADSMVEMQVKEENIKEYYTLSNYYQAKHAKELLGKEIKAEAQKVFGRFDSKIVKIIYETIWTILLIFLFSFPLVCFIVDKKFSPVGIWLMIMCSATLIRKILQFFYRIEQFSVHGNHFMFKTRFREQTVMWCNIERIDILQTEFQEGKTGLNLKAHIKLKTEDKKIVLRTFNKASFKLFWMIETLHPELVRY